MRLAPRLGSGRAVRDADSQRMRQPTRRALVPLGVVIVVALLAVVGCSSGNDGNGAAGDDLPDDAGSRQGQLRDPSFTYQTDVVFVGETGEAVLGATGDGLTWTIDGDAPRAQDLVVGSVMYASSQAVGRVVVLDRVGDDLAVTLAPVELTEVLRDAEIDIDAKIDSDAAEYQEIPNLPGALADITPASASLEIGGGSGPSPDGPLTEQGEDDSGAQSGGGRSAPRLTARPEQSGTPSPPIPPRTKTAIKVAVGNWEAEPSLTPNSIGLRLGYKTFSKESASGGVTTNESTKVFVDLSLATSNLRLRSRMSVRGGVVQPGPTAVLEGIKGVVIDLAAGAADLQSANKQVRVEVPLEVTMPIPDTPLVVQFKFTFAVRMALGGGSSTLTAGGEYGLEGPVGILAGEIVGPKMSVRKSILKSIAGLSIAPSGLAVAVELKAHLGFGIPAAFAGLFAKLIFDVGVTNGSALGFPLVKCVGATLDSWAGGGVGIVIRSEALEALKRLLKTKIDITPAEGVVNMEHRQQTMPEVGACVGGAT